MRFSSQFLDELRDRVPLSDTIGRHVQLRRRGREQLGLCPFHKEKTPSFTVNDEKGFYHCFGCGAHGDVIAFEMDHGGLAFPDAVERLAGIAGVAMPQSSPEAVAREKVEDRLIGVLEAATCWYEGELHGPRGAAALAYVKNRGLNDATIQRFRLGFAPEGRGLLIAALGEQGFSEGEMLETGLLVAVDAPKAPFERFRQRILFPITNRRDRVIAFGGRLFSETSGRLAKYINSPETPLFSKGRVLYGMAAAKAAARQCQEVIVAEGYMDVLALHQAGLSQAVAPLGTALTEMQIAELWRLAPEPILCFDGDAAGLRAATRAAERALPGLRAGYSLRFASLPSGEDPDSLLLGGGAPAMRRLLDAARPLADVLWEACLAVRPADTPERRAALESRLEALVRRIEDRNVQAHYRSDFRARLWQASGRGKGKKAAEASMAVPVTDPVKKSQQILVAIVINHPDLYNDLAERFGSLAFTLPDLDRLRQAIVLAFSEDPGLDTERLTRHLEAGGFSDALAPLLRADFYASAGAFVRPQAPAEQVFAGWTEALRRLHKTTEEAELRDAERALADNLTEETWRRLKGRKQLDNLPTEEASGEGVAPAGTD
ncbi:DNA primase [Rhodospirillaceae bacterium AH-315-P19]|nr:DNA primase [Rhodospirillaceae bacterium AH-315-P19]